MECTHVKQWVRPLDHGWPTFFFTGAIVNFVQYVEGRMFLLSFVHKYKIDVSDCHKVYYNIIRSYESRMWTVCHDYEKVNV